MARSRIGRRPRRDGLARRLLLRYVDRRGGRAVDLEELEHRAATHCRECLASFDTAEKKLHHCHGSGQYLGALCHSCNIAAQTPKTIPVVFHNGGGYDFHFLLRYIATMGSPVSRAPREELGEDSDDEGSESKAEGSEPERPMAKAAPKAKAKAKAAPKPLTGWCALQAAIKQGDYSHLSPLQVGREVPADELGPAEVRGQHERLSAAAA